MLKIIKNPDTEIYENVTRAVHDNQGYCPCMISKSDDTKCPCKEFREEIPIGEECHCGLWIKVEE